MLCLVCGLSGWCGLLEWVGLVLRWVWGFGSGSGVGLRPRGVAGCGLVVEGLVACGFARVGGSLGWVLAGPFGWWRSWPGCCEGLGSGLSCGFQRVVWFAGVGGFGLGLGLGLPEFC